MQKVFLGSVYATIFSVAAVLTVASPSNLVLKLLRRLTASKFPRKPLRK